MNVGDCVVAFWANAYQVRQRFIPQVAIMPVVNLQISLGKTPVVDAITRHALPPIALQHQKALSLPCSRSHIDGVKVFCHVLRFVGTI